MGISGDEEGARNGPSLMPGCDAEAWEVIRPIMEACAAKVPNPARKNRAWDTLDPLEYRQGVRCSQEYRWNDQSGYVTSLF